MALGAPPRSSMTRTSMSYGGGSSRGGGMPASMSALGGGAPQPAVRGAAAGMRRPGQLQYANPFGGGVGGQQPTGQQFNRTDRTALPMQPHLRETYGVDAYGNQYVASSQEHPGYVDPNLRFQLEHEARSREGEGRDRLAEIRETGNQGRLTSGQEQSWTTGERLRGRGEFLEDDRRMFERLPGLWSMITGEGGPGPQTGGGDPVPASMAALTGAAPAKGIAAGGVPGQSGAHGGINPGGGIPGGGIDGLPYSKPGEPATGAAADTGGASAADLAFARAKDKAGLLAGARLKGARSAMGDRSLGTQARAVDSILGDAEQGLTDVATKQALYEAQRSADVEDRNYAGEITRRGQNFGIAPSLFALLRGQGRAY
jgi:hypothetical protein